MTSPTGLPVCQLPSVGAGVGVIAGLAFVAFVLGAAFKSPLTNRAIYNNTEYASIGGLPEGGVVRLVPQEVAVQIASSGFNSPTEKLTDFRSVVTPEGLAWTAFRTPDGAFRIFSKKSQGFVTLNAESTERRVKQSDAELEVAPGQLLTDNLRWRLLKRHYLIDLANPVGALDARGAADHHRSLRLVQGLADPPPGARGRVRRSSRRRDRGPLAR